eukprot:g6142.t1
MASANGTIFNVSKEEIFPCEFSLFGGDVSDSSDDFRDIIEEEEEEEDNENRDIIVEEERDGENYFFSSDTEESSLLNDTRVIVENDNFADEGCEIPENSLSKNVGIEGERLTLSAINPMSKRELSPEDALKFTLKRAVQTPHSERLEIVRRDLKGGLHGFILDNVLSENECIYLSNCAKQCGYSFWDSRPDARKDFRNADTAELSSTVLAEELWERIAKFIEPIDLRENRDIRWQPDLQGEWIPFGTNEKILFAKYGEGGHFAPHTDGYHILDFNRRSMFSIVLFLRDCQSGGGTRFYSDAQKNDLVRDTADRFTGRHEHRLDLCEPRMGRAVIFFHNHMHEGVPPGPNCYKEIIRSDVMFRRKVPICTSKNDIRAFELYQRANAAAAGDEAMKLFQECFRLSPELAKIYGM